jgi:hypothetical protein
MGVWPTLHEAKEDGDTRRRLHAQRKFAEHAHDAVLLASGCSAFATARLYLSGRMGALKRRSRLPCRVAAYLNQRLQWTKGVA